MGWDEFLPTHRTGDPFAALVSCQPASTLGTAGFLVRLICSKRGVTDGTNPCTCCTILEDILSKDLQTWQSLPDYGVVAVHGIAAYDSQGRIVRDTDGYSFLLFGFLWVWENAIDVRNRQAPVKQIGLPGNQAANNRLDEIHQTLSSAVRKSGCIMLPGVIESF